MTSEELRTRAVDFMIEHYGRPITLEPHARDLWYQQLGLLIHFANSLADDPDGEED